jgi:hypothetical protein
MEQHIEIDDELPDLTGTSSPTPTPTSTSTSASTTSSDRRNTRRQTRLDSYARLPVTMPTSSEEDEPVAPVPRSGRRAKKSRSTGSAEADQPELAGNTSTSEIYMTRRGTRATPATPAVPVGYL